jgi:PadR family transcriptional regulator, regulatory protein PadR
MSDRDFLGEFEHLVLLAVARMEPEGYGTVLRQEIEERTGRSVSVGALYATLERLERKGMLLPREGEPTPERGGRARRYYRLTGAGAGALERSRARLDAMWDGVELRPGRA